MASLIQTNKYQMLAFHDFRQETVVPEFSWNAKLDVDGTAKSE